FLRSVFCTARALFGICYASACSMQPYIFKLRHYPWDPRRSALPVALWGCPLHAIHAIPTKVPRLDGSFVDVPRSPLVLSLVCIRSPILGILGILIPTPAHQSHPYIFGSLV